jgi:hypothetical protein
LPTPLSPVMSTVALVGAARRIASHTFCSEALSPSMRYRSSNVSFKRRFSSTSFFWLKALRATRRMRSLSGGFSMKSNAPSLVASTAVFTDPWPDRMTTGGPLGSCFSCFRTSSPSICGILMSRNTMSGW